MWFADVLLSAGLLAQCVSCSFFMHAFRRYYMSKPDLYRTLVDLLNADLCLAYGVTNGYGIGVAILHQGRAGFIGINC